jgi:cytochrome c5
MTTETTVTADGKLSDDVRESPVDQVLGRSRKRRVGVVIALLAVPIVGVLWKFGGNSPVTYSDIGDAFKYGSIGSEPGGSPLNTIGGLLPPREIFLSLPSVCPDRLPGGYASLGLMFESGRDLPIGISERHRFGQDLIGINCALCHTGSYRDSPQSEHHTVLGMPANRLDLQGLFRFVLDCTLDERFTPENVIGRLGPKVGAADRFLLGNFVVGRTRDATLVTQSRVGMLMGDAVTPWGAGRVDTFNPYKSIQFNWKLSQLPHDELNGAADYPALWNQLPREGMHLHWDGNNDSVDERNLSASLGAGVTPVTVDHEQIKRIREWIWTLPPPKYPFAIDAALAGKGERLYETHCRDCHGDHRFRDGVKDGKSVAEAKSLGEITPIAEIDTDPSRLSSYTYEFSANQNWLYPGSVYQFKHFRKTNGYANQPLDGIWLRAPYLHNGSVPTLRDLLEPPAKRPISFYRGYDVYDPVKLGFVVNVPEEGGQKFTLYDTGLAGNHNGGHLYGTTLPDDAKAAIVEYMKRF